VAHPQAGAVSVRLLSLANPEEWAATISRMPHGPGHTHWYNAALSASTDDQIVLFDYGDGENRAACPLLLRRYGDSVDIATPYGFGGFTTQGRCDGLPDAFRRFASAQGWICGYLALNPLLPHPFAAADGLERGSTIYALDLSLDEDLLLASMHPTHRREVRKSLVLLESVVTDGDSLRRALPSLYVDTLARVGASETYRFSRTTLNAWLSSPGSLLLGVGEPPQAVVLCLYTSEIADFFISAGTTQGRSHTRTLLWAALRELKRRGVRFFNLGGGARSGDDLDAFKRRFGGRSVGVPVLKQVYMHERFAALCREARAEDRSSGYFPPYRDSR
jgi:hypothetical protein